MLLVMGRTRHIAKDAKATTISLTIPQQIAFQELQVRRLKAGSAKPTLTEVMLEGFQLVLRREELSGTEMERIFPELIQTKATKAEVQVINRRRRR
jgi:hypothetical protein